MAILIYGNLNNIGTLQQGTPEKPLTATSASIMLSTNSHLPVDEYSSSNPESNNRAGSSQGSQNDRLKNIYFEELKFALQAKNISVNINERELLDAYQTLLIEYNKANSKNSENIENNFRNFIKVRIEGAVSNFTKNQEITSEILNNEIDQASFIISAYGSMEKYYKVCKGSNDTLMQRLNEFYPNPNMSLEDKIRGYVDWLINVRAKDSSNPEKLIKQDITKLLDLSSDEERQYFFMVAEEFLNTNYANSEEEACYAIRATMAFYDNKTEAANAAIKHKAINTANRAGMNCDEFTDLSMDISSNADNEHAQEFNAQAEDIVASLWEENEPVLREILAKQEEAIANNTTPEFTPEEQAILDEYQRCVGLRTGQNIGYANNENLTEEEKLLLYNEILSCDANRDLLLRDTYQNIQNIIEENPEILNMTKEEFKDFMDKVSDNKYSETNNTYTEPTPSTTEISSIPTNKTITPFKTENTVTMNPLPVSQFNTEDTITTPDSNKSAQRLAAQKEVSSALKQGPSGVMIYLMKHQGYGVVELLGQDNLPPYAKNYAITWFKTYETEQENILTTPGIESSVVAQLLPHTLDKVLVKLEQDNETFSSYRTKQLVEKAVEDIEEIKKEV